VPDNTASGGERSRQPGPDLLVGNRHVHVHCVPQRLGLVKILHPDRWPMTERVDRVVAGQRVVPEDGPPEARIDVSRVRRDGELHFLRTGAIRGSSMPARDRRDGSCEANVTRLQLPQTTRQPHGKLVVGDGDEDPLAFDAGHLCHRVSKPRRIAK